MRRRREPAQWASLILLAWFAIAGAVGLWLGRTVRARDRQVPTSEERFAQHVAEAIQVCREQD